MPDLVPPDEKTRHERLRIARDLHDTVAQRLAGLGFAMDALIADESLSPESKRSLREIRMDLSAVVGELREEILALRNDPASPIESWLSERLNVSIEWNEIEPLSITNQELEELRYLLLELLQNAEQHRGIRAVTIALLGAEVIVTYRDSGSQRVPHVRDELSMGRVGIRERVQRLGARLDESLEGFALRWL